MRLFIRFYPSTPQSDCKRGGRQAVPPQTITVDESEQEQHPLPGPLRPLQRVGKPLDVADRGRIHVRERLAEKDVTSVTRAVDSPAVHAHSGRQEHLEIFQT